MVGFLYNGSWSSTYVAAFSSFDISGVRTRGTSRFVASSKAYPTFESGKHNGIVDLLELDLLVFETGVFSSCCLGLIT